MDLTEAMELFEEIEKRFKCHQDDLSEFRTRIILIDPVLRLLGWDVENPDLVVLEYQPATSKRESADYILKHNKKNVAIVEAKNIDKKIDDLEYREQADNYARYAGVRFFILTNGVKWLLYERTLTTGLELLEPIVSFDIIHDEPYQCALAAISMWRPNLVSGGPSKVTEPVLISLKPAPNRSGTEPDDPREDFEACYILTSERRYPRHTTPTRLKIGNHRPVKVELWLDVIHEIVAWLIGEKILRSDDCPIEIGQKIFIARKGTVNRDGSPIKDPRELPNSLILQRGNLNTVLQWQKLRQLLDQYKDKVDQNAIQVFYKLAGKTNR